MSIRGVRGATVASRDEPEAILSATRELLDALLIANPLMQVEDLASALFTVTGDLTAVHPAKAARQLGWEQVPLMCALEIPVPESLPRCIRFYCIGIRICPNRRSGMSIWAWLPACGPTLRQTCAIKNSEIVRCDAFHQTY